FPIESDKSEKYTALHQEVSEKISISKSSIPDEISEKHVPPAPKLPPSRATQTQNPEQKSPEVPLIKQEISRQWIKSSKGLPEQKKEKEFNTEIEKVGLKLNPEDYMVKIRPKTLGSVPKDAKSKLKTSAYGHVSNVPKEKETPDIAQTKKTIQMNINENTSKVKPPTRPSELFNISPQLPAQQPSESVKVDKPVEIHKPPILEESPQIPIEDDKLSPTIDIQQSEHAKKTLIELKLKKADLYKMTLDFDMKELTGEISAEELAEKKKKINEYEEKIENQIQELEKLLGK
ncbi:MAG: hypothetical protein KAX18_07065, partial [Candidatus Lokiarchaeota archaeon]|nr:hypothetical protein [Candidatus Lokiarchaeota archaeon]